MDQGRVMPGFVIVSEEDRRLTHQDLRMRSDVSHAKWVRLWKFLENYLLTHIYWFRQSRGYRSGKRFAADHDRRILLAFSGITWCGPCMMLEAAFQDELFETYALDQELVLINVDYDPTTLTPEDLTLLSEFDMLTSLTPDGRYGFPMVFGLASDGSPLGPLVGVEGYPDGGLIEWLEFFDAVINQS